MTGNSIDNFLDTLLDDTIESINFHQVLTLNKPMLVTEKGGKIEWSVIDDKDFWVRDDPRG